MPYFPLGTVSRYYYFTDIDGDAFDPDTKTFTIYKPDGTEAQTATALASTGTTGKWQMDYNLPTDAEEGDWTIKIIGTITSGTRQRTVHFKFNVGAPA